MRNINRIDPFLDELDRVWHKYPELRFGQLIVNILGKKESIFYQLEEKDFLKLLKKFEKEMDGENKTSSPLTKEEQKLLNKAKKLADKGDFSLRSCWNCNPAHEHLKDADYLICCFECGCYFYKGQNITDLAIRAENGKKQ